MLLGQEALRNETVDKPFQIARRTTLEKRPQSRQRNGCRIPLADPLKNPPAIHAIGKGAERLPGPGPRAHEASRKIRRGNPGKARATTIPRAEKPYRRGTNAEADIRDTPDAPCTRGLRSP